MRIYHRPYNDQQNDFKKMWDFLIQDYRDRNGEFIWTLGRITDWKYGVFHDKKYVPSFLRNNVQLWLNAFDELVGFAISEEGNRGFSVFVKKGYGHLNDKIVDWVLENWHDRGDFLAIEVHEFQPDLMQVLDARGFVCGEPIAITRRYKVSSRDEKIELPEGYAIVDMLTDGDVNGKNLLQKNGFSNEDFVTELDAAAYAYNRESPIYNPFYDLAVVTADGVYASGCLAFVDYENSYAEIERVCTHRDYRQKGLCEAVLRECFRRLKQEGVEYAYITGYSEAAKGLYGKLEEVAQRKWYLYKKDLK